jgi:hypothetical protein
MPPPLSARSVLDTLHIALDPLRDAFIDGEDPRIASALAELLALRDAIVIGEAVEILHEAAS